NVVVQVPVNVASDGINTGPPQHVTVTSIWNSERVAALTVKSNQVQEGQSVEVEVNLSGAPFSTNTIIPLTYPRTVTNDDTATEPADYTQLPSVTIVAGSQTGSGFIATRDDDVYEGNETFDVALGTLPDEIKRGDPALQTITIIENDTPPTVILSPTTVSVTEGETITVKVTLSRSMPNTVTIPLTLSPVTAIASEDYAIPEHSEVTISRGNTMSTMDISTRKDNLLEEDETFTVSFGELPPDVKGSSQIEVTIIDDTDAEIIISPNPVAVVEGRSEIVEVSLAAGPSQDVILMISGHKPPLFPPSQLQLIFTSENWREPQSVTLTADTDPNSFNETIDLILTANGGGYVALSARLRVNITDNDIPQLVVDQSSLDVREGDSAPLMISLSSMPISATRVTVSPSPNQDLSYSLLPLMFSTTNWEDPQTLMFTAREDYDFKDDGPHELTLSAIGYTDREVGVKVKIIDNDEPQLNVTVDVLTLQEGGEAGFQVSLNGEPSNDVEITFAGYEESPLRPPIFYHSIF
ncbi:MAG: hypothetical protein OXF06_05470, partial [Bacteroidetes bacterium]|nr:hypothetical protein [Bacteroidota bacterium]